MVTMAIVYPYMCTSKKGKVGSKQTHIHMELLTLLLMDQRSSTETCNSHMEWKDTHLGWHRADDRT